MLELIMVILIIGVLAALAVPQYTNFLERAKLAEALNYIGAIKTAEMAYMAVNSNGDFGSLQQLGLPNSTPHWNYSVATGTGSIAFYIDMFRNGGPYNGKYVTLEYHKDGKHYWSGSYPFIPKD
jgi:type IV pilus assembly protein PilA